MYYQDEGPSGHEAPGVDGDGLDVLQASGVAGHDTLLRNKSTLLPVELATNSA